MVPKYKSERKVVFYLGDIVANHPRFYKGKVVFHLTLLQQPMFFWKFLTAKFGHKKGPFPIVYFLLDGLFKLMPNVFH